MKIQGPPGMRDFYPADMRFQNWLFDVWRRVSRAFGFVEYDGPIFEKLDLYRLKSGDEIVAQLFLVSRGGGESAKADSTPAEKDAEPPYAIRPEMTPTLARMVAAQANTLPRPMKWFSIPRMCRAERQQRGRLREFFQWNADILGSDDIIADAETIALAASCLREVGLRQSDAAVRFSDRRLATAMLVGLGLAPDQCAPAFRLIDRVDKLPPEEFARQWQALCASTVSSERIRELLDARSLEECLALANAGAARGADWTADAAAQFTRLTEHLNDFGVGAYCTFDPAVVRGIAYYTGVVFETFLRRGSLRALQGGGRYDELITLLDGPRLSGVGFGMGDAPLQEALVELGLAPTLTEGIDVYVIVADERAQRVASRVAAACRAAGLRTELPYKRQAVGKQFKQASDRGATVAVVLGAESVERDELAVKTLATGVQVVLRVAALIADPRGAIAAPPAHE